MDYSAMYHIMFSAAQDAVDEIRACNMRGAEKLLMRAQQLCEDNYLSAAEDEGSQAHPDTAPDQ